MARDTSSSSGGCPSRNPYVAQIQLPDLTWSTADHQILGVGYDEDLGVWSVRLETPSAETQELPETNVRILHSGTTVHCLVCSCSVLCMTTQCMTNA